MDREHGVLRDAPFLLAACFLHGVVFLEAPALRRGGAPRAEEAAVPIEFVEALPPSPLPAPQPPPGDDRRDAPSGSSARPPKPDPKPKARAAPRRMPKARPRPDPAAQARAREAAESRRLAAEERGLALLRARRAESLRRAEVEAELALLPSPEEALLPAPAPAAAPGASGRGREEFLAEDPVFDSDVGAEDSRPPGPAAGGGGAPGGEPVSWALEGPAGRRRLLRRAVPACPGWVPARGLDLSVRLKFRVAPDGSVREGVLIERTSGFPDLDLEAIQSLRRWRFEASAVPAAGPPETWGIVRFRFVGG